MGSAPGINPPHEPGAGGGCAARLSRAVMRLGHYRRALKAWNLAAYRATLVTAGIGLGALAYWL